MYENLGLDLSPLAASAMFGGLLGLLFGFFAQRSKFCLRRALVESDLASRRQAKAVWFTALAFAVLGTQLSVLIGWLDFSGHRFHTEELPILAIVAGGLLFGAGMVLTRGCASRLTVLAGSGNLRALLVLILFAITAHATLKGVLATARTQLSEFTITSSFIAPLTQSSGQIILFVLIVLAVWVWLLRGSGVQMSKLVFAALIGLLVPIAWVGTGFVLQDDFDPITFESLSFTSSSSEWLFWSVASTSIGAGFGVGLISGVFVGSALTAVAFREFQWVSFESPRQTGRYLSGAVLMGIGGVLAGGCTVGAGLSGMSSLSVSALLALISITLGGVTTNALLHGGRDRALAQKSASGSAT